MEWHSEDVPSPRFPSPLTLPRFSLLLLLSVLALVSKVIEFSILSVIVGFILNVANLLCHENYSRTDADFNEKCTHILRWHLSSRIDLVLTESE